jgi:hypothetical protein
MPTVKRALRSEFDKKKNNWASMPETMIKKVAESQALRFAFPDIFAGTYHESEQWKEGKTTQTISSNTGVNFEEIKPDEEPVAEITPLQKTEEHLATLNDEQFKQFEDLYSDEFGDAPMRELLIPDLKKAYNLINKIKKEVSND